MFLNNRGQALVEASLIIPVLIFFLIFIIQALLYLTVELAVDDAMENYLLCEVRSAETLRNLGCTTRLYQNLQYLPLSAVNFRLQKTGTTHSFSLQGTALQFFHFKKNRQLDYDTRI